MKKIWKKNDIKMKDLKIVNKKYKNKFSKKIWIIKKSNCSFFYNSYKFKNSFNEIIFIPNSFAFLNLLQELSHKSK